MPPKGQTNNPAGRPRGSQNKATKDLKLVIRNFLENNADNFQRRFNSLPAESYVKHYITLLKYSSPPAPANTELDFNDLSDDQLDYIATIVREGRRPKLKDIAARSRSALGPQEDKDTERGGAEDILVEHEPVSDVQVVPVVANTPHSAPDLRSHLGAPEAAATAGTKEKRHTVAANKRPKKAVAKKKTRTGKHKNKRPQKQNSDSENKAHAKLADVATPTPHFSDASLSLAEAAPALHTDLPQADEPPADPLMRFLWEAGRKGEEARKNAAMHEDAKPAAPDPEIWDVPDDPLLIRRVKEKRANRDMYRTYDDIADQI